MNLVNAIRVFFSKTAPAGADFAGAFNTLRGKRDTDLSQADVTTLDELAESFQDFVSDPAGWLKKASTSDPRYSWWVKLAQALGASVTSGSAPATANPSSSPGVAASAASAAPAVPEPEQGIDPDELAGGAPPPIRREGGGSKERSGGFTINTVGGDDDDRPRRDKRKLRGRDRDEDDERDDRHRETREREPPEPPPRPKPLWVPTRDIPEITKRILASAPYKRYNTRIRDAYVQIRDANPAVSQAGRAKLARLRRAYKQMEKGTEYLGSMSAGHLAFMVLALEQNRDLTDPAWFQANYVTGTYAD